MTSAHAALQLQALCNSNQWPQLEAVATLDAGYTLDLYINDHIQWLTGHFPQQPLVAGVVQTHWAGEFSETLFGLGNIQQIDNLKFQDVMLPEQTVQLSLEYNREKNSVKFCYHKPDQADQIFSEGKIQFQLVGESES